MKYVLVIGDGMADNPLQELGGKTPLQFAEIPVMDRLASAGMLGEVRTIPEGMPAGSDTAILSIFGCDPSVCYTGRAPLEAAASGITLSPGDVAYRCNMVTFEDEAPSFEDKRIISHSAGAVEGGVANELIAELFDTPAFRQAASGAGIVIYPGSSFRHLAVQKTPDIAGMKLMPPHDHLGETVGQNLPCGCENAVVLDGLMRLAHEILDRHTINDKRRSEGKLPANGIWFWAEGTAVELPDFTEQYGKSGGIISAVPLCLGIGTLIGLDTISVDGATGELNTNYEGKVGAVFDALKTGEFVAVHIEAPDECSHAGDIKGKLQAIEWLDSRVVEPLISGLDKTGENYRMLILSDHKTLLSTGGHDGTPVPYIIYDSRLDRKSGFAFCESDAAYGRYIAEGTELMGLLFEAER